MMRVDRQSRTDVGTETAEGEGGSMRDVRGGDTSTGDAPGPDPPTTLSPFSSLSDFGQMTTPEVEEDPPLAPHQVASLEAAVRKSRVAARRSLHEALPGGAQGAGARWQMAVAKLRQGTAGQRKTPQPAPLRRPSRSASRHASIEPPLQRIPDVADETRDDGGRPASHHHPGAVGTGSRRRSGWAHGPPPPWLLKADDVTIVKGEDGEPVVLGQGAGGTVVYRALYQEVEEVAVRLPSAAAMDALQHRRDLAREMGQLLALCSPRVVPLYGVVLSPPPAMVVVQLMEGGSLERLLEEGGVDWYNRGAQIALEVAEGLAYLHSRNVLHLDLRPKNILLGREGLHAQIADVGLARLLPRGNGSSRDVHSRGSTAFSAPEITSGRAAGGQADVFSLGAVMHALAAGLTPTTTSPPPPLPPLSSPSQCPSSISSLVARCLALDPQSRPTAKQVVMALVEEGGE